eukprot:TRINITY_DN615_c1_g1_i1.p1 TRINITY_DN615_c1_g1~~TRINITY_DN615_c1_g1_i1.p1  ORF type:complete len:355 (+),score=51.53 TRINITY_DN615_c1_g1_i1:98-1162(+)
MSGDVVESPFKYPSLWRVPTALFHLITMEMVPIWGVGFAAVTLSLHISSYDVRSNVMLKDSLYCSPKNDSLRTGTLRTAHSSDGHVESLLHTELCFASVISKEVNSPLEADVRVCAGCEDGGVLDCSKAPEFLQLARNWAGIGWFGFMLCCAFAVYILLAYFLSARENAGAGYFHSFGSGAYIHFCWDLERTLIYKVLLWTTTLYAVGYVSFVVCYYVFRRDVIDQALADEDHGFLFTFTTLAKSFGIDMAVLIVCVKKLWSPAVRAHHWIDARQEFRKVVFKRNWAALHEGNDTFGQKLVDALWRYLNGQRKPLETLFSEEHSEMSIESFVKLCSNLQKCESGGDESCTEDED